jgi:hypothetical protein
MKAASFEAVFFGAPGMERSASIEIIPPPARADFNWLLLQAFTAINALTRTNGN